MAVNAIPTKIVPPISIPTGDVDDTEYHWLHNRYQEMLMHEDELLNDRTSFMLTASSIFIGAYFVSVSISPSRPASIVTTLTLAFVGLYLCWDWQRVVNRTVSALELWRGILLRFERPRLDQGGDLSRLHAIYWQHELAFGENAAARLEHHDQRTIGEEPPAVAKLGLSDPKPAGTAPLRVQLYMPYVFALAWVIIVIVTVLQVIPFSL